MRFKIKFTQSWFALVLFLLACTIYELFFLRSMRSISFSDALIFVLLIFLTLSYVFKIFKKNILGKKQSTD
ncbi:hypothetical protein SAMN04487988_105176 [Algoriphagus hitonicola]|uniref:Lipoprotein n=1 Tax=Algoriphagus hitonicola TaxID=435880 RepID=A0A1I2T8P7_9BACT|nr:hypothetical protein SAMN04487988_105176 [Algoriphagus hitonicola]